MQDIELIKKVRKSLLRAQKKYNNAIGELTYERCKQLATSCTIEDFTSIKSVELLIEGNISNVYCSIAEVMGYYVTTDKGGFWITQLWYGGSYDDLDEDICTPEMNLNSLKLLADFVETNEINICLDHFIQAKAEAELHDELSKVIRQIDILYTTIIFAPIEQRWNIKNFMKVNRKLCDFEDAIKATEFKQLVNTWNQLAGPIVDIDLDLEPSVLTLDNLITTAKEKFKFIM